ncbi:unnamed protein product [Ixodes pacificus]
MLGTCPNIAPKLGFTLLNTENIMAQAPLHVRIVLVGLCEFSELPILAPNNLLFYFISPSVSNTDNTYSEFLQYPLCSYSALACKLALLSALLTLLLCTAVKR